MNCSIIDYLNLFLEYDYTKLIIFDYFGILNLYSHDTVLLFK